MSNFIIFSNIHLGLELLGAVIFFVISWLFFEAYLIKRDIFSATRTLGFLLLSISQVFHSTFSFSFNYSGPTYALGIIFLILSFGLEKLPTRPNHNFVFLPLISFFNKPVVSLVLSLIFFSSLLKRYFKNVEKLLKPLVIGFLFLTISFLVGFFSDAENFNLFYVLEHGLKLIAFLGIGAWGWRLLSLRIREEALLVFIGTSLFISLLLTTIFSTILLKRIESEVKENLSSSARIFNFYVNSLKSKSLASLQTIAKDDDFVSSFIEKNLKDLGKVSTNLVDDLDLDFITVALPNGNVIFKLNFPIVSGENILTGTIGLEALEGKNAVTLGVSGEGFSIRAATPIFVRGRISGVLIGGYLLNNNFLEDFKNISNFESSVFVDNKVFASTIFSLGDELKELLVQNKVKNGEEFLGSTDFFGEDIIGSFSPIKNIDGRVVATLAITTTPGELLAEARGTNQLTLFIVSLIVLSLIVPLYKFSIFLTS